MESFVAVVWYYWRSHAWQGLLGTRYLTVWAHPSQPHTNASTKLTRGGGGKERKIYDNFCFHSDIFFHKTSFSALWWFANETEHWWWDKFILTFYFCSSFFLCFCFTAFHQHCFLCYVCFSSFTSTLLCASTPCATNAQPFMWSTGAQDPKKPAAKNETSISGETEEMRVAVTPFHATITRPSQTVLTSLLPSGISCQQHFFLYFNSFEFEHIVHAELRNVTNMTDIFM